MDFDPLDLFTPEPRLRPDDEENSHNYLINEDVNNELVTPETSTDEEKDSMIIHIFDLPTMSYKPPEVVLLTILNIFKPKPQYNFDGNNQEVENDEQFFRNREISEEMLSVTINWFKTHGFTKPTTLESLKKVSDTRFIYPTDFFNYLTNIISCDLHWVNDKEKIWKIAGFRLAENCGRTAQPEINRKIVFENVKDFSLTLIEPSLTEDNLGLKTWGSSLILSERLLKNYLINEKKSSYLRKPILELGSGTGLVGMTCGYLEKLGKISNSSYFPKFQKQIFLTDLDAIVKNLQDNVNLNELNNVCEVLELNWMDSKFFDEKVGIVNNTNIFNTLILSDPIYSNSHVYLVIDMIKKYLNFSNKAQLILELPQRPKYEEARELLWRLIKNDEKLSKLKLINEDLESGFDDFGAQKLIFKHWIV